MCATFSRQQYSLVGNSNPSRQPHLAVSKYEAYHNNEFSLCLIYAVYGFDQSVTEAAYINDIYSIGSSFVTKMVGFALKHYGRVGYYTIFLGAPFFIISQGSVS